MIAIISISALAGLFVVGWFLSNPETKLSELENKLAKSYPEIQHISPAKFNAWQNESRPVVVLDIREEDEFDVSHIAGAIRIPPESTADQVNQLLADKKIAGADVVFYCSVGVRSSRLAARASQSLKNAGAERIANLRGGVFRWHNEERPLIAGKSSTLYVHPYDQMWGRLLKRRPFIKTTKVSKHE